MYCPSASVDNIDFIGAVAAAAAAIAAIFVNASFSSVAVILAAVASALVYFAHAERLVVSEYYSLIPSVALITVFSWYLGFGILATIASVAIAAVAYAIALHIECELPMLALTLSILSFAVPRLLIPAVVALVFSAAEFAVVALRYGDFTPTIRWRG